MKIITQKQFDKALVDVGVKSIDLQNIVHKAAMFSLFHCNEHNNTTPAKQLIEVMPKSQRRETLKAWFIKFGQFQTDDKGTLEFKGKKRVTDNKESILSKADETPYWMLIKEQSAEKQLVSLNFETRILGLFKALEKADSVEAQELMKTYWEVTPETIREKLFA